MHNSWLLTIAIGTSIVAIGTAADFLLREREVTALQAVLLRWADVLMERNLSVWQRKIAEAFVTFLEELLSKTILVLDIIAIMVAYPVAKPILNRPVSEQNRGDALAGAARVLLAIVIGGIFILVVIALILLVSDSWIPMTILVPPLLCMSLWPFLTTKVSFVDVLVPSSFISTTMSTLSIWIIVVTLDHSSMPSDFWFAETDAGFQPTHPIILASISFAFSMAILLTTYSLIKQALADTIRFFSSIVATTVVTAALSFTYVFIVSLIASRGSLSHGINDSLAFFTDGPWVLIRKGNHAKGAYMWSLLVPILAPIALFSLTMISISFSKGLSLLSNRLLTAAGERKDSIFKQTAILIASWVAACKALYDYLISG